MKESPPAPMILGGEALQILQSNQKNWRKENSNPNNWSLQKIQKKRKPRTHPCQGRCRDWQTSGQTEGLSGRQGGCGWLFELSDTVCQYHPSSLFSHSLDDLIASWF